jgi:formamidopyrimidine-DNA glycosylase
MPELPEVETVVRRLRPTISGQQVHRLDLLWPRTLATPSLTESQSILAGRTVVGVSRRAKYIIIEFSGSYFLLVHLRMSGDLLFHTQAPEPGRHTRARLLFGSGAALHFEDARKFGRWSLVSACEEALPKLGPEPLGQEFTLEWFRAALAQKRKPIKTLLLDQSFLAGLGNIYAVESLWHAKVSPRRLAAHLSAPQMQRLHQAIINVLTSAVQSQGTDLGDGVWKHGAFETKAYGKKGLPCARCASLLRRIVMGQRGTEYCPKCQR